MGNFPLVLDQAQDEVLDLSGPCGFKGVPQRKVSVPGSTAPCPRAACWCALAQVARDAQEQWDTPFHSGVARGCWHCGDPGWGAKGPTAPGRAAAVITRRGRGHGKQTSAGRAYFPWRVGMGEGVESHGLLWKCSP